MSNFKPPFRIGETFGKIQIIGYLGRHPVNSKLISSTQHKYKVYCLVCHKQYIYFHDALKKRIRTNSKSGCRKCFYKEKPNHYKVGEKSERGKKIEKIKNHYEELRKVTQMKWKP